MAAPFTGGDVIAVTNSPSGYVTLLGLDSGTSTVARSSRGTAGHEYLEHMDLEGMREAGNGQAAPKIKSYGRTMLDEFVEVGESVWVD